MNNRSEHDNNSMFSLEDLAEDPQSIPDALTEVGWNMIEGEAEMFALEQHQRAELTLTQQGAQWSRYRLSSESLREPQTSALLAQNMKLELSAKFVVGPQQRVDCVVDVPLEALTQPDSQPDRLIQDTGGLARWSRGLTGALTGERPDLRHTPVEEIAPLLSQLGWAATAEGEALQVHLQLPGVYRRLSIETGDFGYRVSSVLIPLGELSSASARAVRQLSLEANRHLPLVRFSEDVLSDPPQLLAEVYINVALVPDVWLVQALSAVEAAVTTTSRELLALRDPELAQIFLAAY